MTQDDLIDCLNDLIETSKDGEYGFRKAAETLRDAETRQFFMTRADECKAAASELQAHVSQLGGTPEDSGSTSGAVHRGWIAMKGSITGYSDLAILEESESSEDGAVESYREALDQELPASVRSMLERQFEGVKRNHARVRALRDEARARNP